MKAILISDHAKWCALMMNGIKKIEARKGTALYKAIQKLIDEYGYAEFYVYCTKGKPNLWFPYEYDCFELDEASQPYLSDNPIVDIDTKMNGKVIFKFRCYKVEEIAYQRVFEENPFHFLEEESGYGTETLNANEFKKETCLTDKELENYLNTDKPNKRACAIHISNLEIFDRPRELCEFHTNIKKEPPEELLCPECGKPMEYYEYKYLTKAPQSWCYVEDDSL